jgi:oligopeptide/dipeptide ABC transporter ATP-binding protein
MNNKIEKNNDKILEVKNLRVSFKTNGGTVKAVRGISFDLFRGKTLAIVGESGSGKSVTSKAILGILASNSIVEDGQIIFDGKDLLKLTEDEFTKIRGVKISMIFQDPLSSLNPIMKVGPQLTEAMYLKAKATRREAKSLLKKFNKVLVRYDENGEYTTLIEYASTIKSKEDKIYLDKHLPIFKRAVLGSIKYQQEKLKTTKIEVEKLYEEFFKDGTNNFDNVDPRNEIKKIGVLLKNCSMPLSYESDDTLEVYKISMLNYYQSYNQAIKLFKKREKLLAKYKCQTIFDLPSEVRAKQKEVIISNESYFEAMKKTTEVLINHIDKLLNATLKQEEKVGRNIISKYFEFVVESKTYLTKSETKQRALKMLEEVGIPEPERRYTQYPFEFSGGMRQRIVIAIALSSNPDVLICDEPTTALDVTIQAQILELINKLKVEKNLSIIFITHDLGVVANMADDIAVMYAGKIVEYGTVFDIFYDSRHPYTWTLLGSMPDLETKEKLNAIPGTPPNMLLPPKGDAFAERNKYALEQDFDELPPFFRISNTHSSASWLCHKDAPDIVVSSIVSNRIKKALIKYPENMPKSDLKKNSILNYIEIEGSNDAK